MNPILINKFYIKDLRDWEDVNRSSLFSLFEEFNYSKLMEFVKLGNGLCSDMQASDIIDKYMEVEENNIEKALTEIRICLVGDKKADKDADDSGVEYNNISDMFSDMFMKLDKINITYGDFWKMTTREVNNSFNGIKDKVVDDINLRLMTDYNLANMIMAGLAGKMPDKPPRINDKSSNESEDNIEDDEDAETDISAALKFANGLINTVGK